MSGCNLCRFFIRLLPVLLGTALICNKSGAAEDALQRLHNPFCSVDTFARRDLPSQGLALIELGGHTVIYLDLKEAAGDPAYRDFLMAHECCHHTRGHLRRLQKKGEERTLLAFSFVNRSLELDADCCAAVALANAGKLTAIREAARRMRIYGVKPTGAGGYPAGILRADLIEQCAASTTAPASPDHARPGPGEAAK